MKCEAMFQIWFKYVAIPNIQSITVRKDFKNEEKNRIKNWVGGLCKAASGLIFRTAILEENKQSKCG